MTSAWKDAVKIAETILDDDKATNKQLAKITVQLVTGVHYRLDNLREREHERQDRIDTNSNHIAHLQGRVSQGTGLALAVAVLAVLLKLI